MTLDLNDAGKAMREVLAKYDKVLPDGLGAKVGSLSVSSIFHILPHSQYHKHFDAYYRSFFAAINVVALGKGVKKGGTTKKLIDLAWSDNSFGCPAFCAPAVQVTDRKIYVNEDAGNTIGTLYHEFIHYLSHGNFYPEMYAMGGKNPKILEGVTEYLTRAVSPAVKKDRADQGKYEAWYSLVCKDITGSDDKVMARMAAMAFQGKLDDVKTLGGTLPLLPPSK